MKTKKETTVFKEKEFWVKLKTDNKELFSEIVSFTELLRECGVTNYRLSGSLQEPIVTTYSIM
jgi:hypothetical protein